MKETATTPRFLLALPLFVLALSACERRAEDGGAGKGDEAAPTLAPAEPERKTSILRPEIAPEPIEEPRLDPLEVTIPFAKGGAELSDQAIAALERLMASEQVRAGGRIVLRGHSDAGGNDRANLEASRKRAEAVRQWLIDHGIEDKRIEVIAFGEQNPIQPNAQPDGTANEAGRAANRRVEITVEVPDVPPGKIGRADQAS